MLSKQFLRELAIAKVSDAHFLLQHGRYANSYYLHGYGIELGLKACISRVFLAETIPDKRLVLDIYSHDLVRLAGMAGLTAALDARKLASVSFAANWATVANWSEESRYEVVDQFEATAMDAAMMDQQDGVFPWLQLNW